MVTGAVARVVRQQGQRRLLAWRGALAELQPQGPEPQQQGAAGAAAGAAAAQQQQCCGLRSLAPSAPSCSVSFAAAAGVPAWQPSLLLQSRGMALNFSRYQPRKKQEQRQLPERNLEIKAAQVRKQGAGWKSGSAITCQFRSGSQQCTATLPACPRLPAYAAAPRLPMPACPEGAGAVSRGR